MAWTAEISIRVEDTELSLEEAFPDGLGQADPTAENVLEALRNHGSVIRTLDDWMLLEELTVGIKVTSEDGTVTTAEWEIM